jgi:hypothetical protein
MLCMAAAYAPLFVVFRRRKVLGPWRSLLARLLPLAAFVVPSLLLPLLERMGATLKVSHGLFETLLLAGLAVCLFATAISLHLIEGGTGDQA